MFSTVVVQSYQQCIRILISLYAQQHLFFLILVAILIGVMCYLIIILICDSVMIIDIDHHSFSCWLCIHSYIFLEKCVLKSFVHFLMSYLFSCCVLEVVYTGTPHFIALHYIVLHRYCFIFFFFLICFFNTN